jgi:hypothetical protein
MSEVHANVICQGQWRQLTLTGQRVGKVWVTLVVVEMKQRGPRCVRDEVSWVLPQGQGQGIHTSCSAWRWDDSAVDAS